MLSVWLISVVFIFIYFYNKKKAFYAAGDKFPGPKAYPILGNSLDFVNSSNGNFKKIMEFTWKYDRFYRIWNNGKLFVFCYEPEDVEILLSSNKELKKTDLYRFLKPWIGEGLISTSDIPLWRSHRKIITPTFHFKILHDFLDGFNRNAQILCERLKTKDGKGPFDVHHIIKLAALDNICETAMGINVNAQKNSDSEYVNAIQNLANVVSLRFFKVWLMIDLFFNMSKYAELQKKCIKVLHDTTNRLIRQKREERTKLKPKTEDEDSTFSEKKKVAFLDLLLQSEEGAKLSDKELREEVDTFMFAGHDTISSAISFTIYCLAQEQEIQEKAYEEQLEIFGESDRMPTYADIQEMKYLERVLKEGLRLYPSVPLIGRELTEDLTLPGDYLVPQGTQFILNIFALHRHPKVWPNPDKFNPDNFLPEAAQARNPYAYVPFSAGGRNCVGQKYAMLSMKATLSLILRKYKILPSPYPEHKLNLAAELILVSTGGLHVQVEPRT